MMAASFAAGVIITIYRDGRLTRSDVPEGSAVRISPEGDVYVTLPSVSTSVAEAAPSDFHALQGVWQVTAAAHGGRELSPDELANSSFSFDQSRFAWRRGTGPPLSATYRLDPLADPKMIRLYFPGDSPDVVYGIYRLEGDRLWLMLGEPGGGRPTTWGGPEPTHQFVRIELRRSDKPLPTAEEFAAAQAVNALAPPVTPRPVLDDAESVELSRDEGFPPRAAPPQIAHLSFLITPVRGPSATAPSEPDSNAILSPRTTISEAEAEWHIQHLQQHGPDRSPPGSAGYHSFSYQWFELAQPLPDQGLVTAQYRNRSYVLLSTSERDVLIHGAGGGPAWGVEEVKITRDTLAQPSIAIQLDHAGGEALSALTRNHLGDHLAILAGNRVLAAPRVITTVGRSLMITGAFTDEQVRQMFQLLAPANDNDE